MQSLLSAVGYACEVKEYQLDGENPGGGAEIHCCLLLGRRAAAGGGGGGGVAGGGWVGGWVLFSSEAA